MRNIACLVVLIFGLGLISAPVALPALADEPGSAECSMKQDCPMMSGGSQACSMQKKNDCDWSSKRAGWSKRGWKDDDCGRRICRGLLIALAILNILLAITVAADLRKNSKLSGLWVVIVLIGSIPATVAYALFRLVEQRDSKPNGIA